jgi:hypothetical protein
MPGGDMAMSDSMTTNNVSEDMSSDPGATCSMCSGSCVNTMTDNRNCGACEHSCGPGLCAGGTCQPFPISISFSGGGGNAGPYRFRTDGVSLFTKNSKEIRKCAIPGCDGGEQIVVTDPNNNIINDFVLDADYSHLYYSDQTQLLRCTLPRCAAQEVIFDGTSSGATLGAILVVGDSIYFSVTSASKAVLKVCSTAGPFPCTNTAPDFVTRTSSELATDGLSLIGMDSSSIFRCKFPSCTGIATSLIDGLTNPRTLKILGGKLYWFNYDDGSLSTCSISNCQPTAKVILTGQQLGNPVGLDGDQTYVYAGSLSDHSLLGKCMLSNCAGTLTKVVAIQDDPTLMIMSPDYIYWLSTKTTPGKVFGLAR